jgi:hypothetical protein
VDTETAVPRAGTDVVPHRGLPTGAVGLAGLMAQSLGVTGPEISAVVIAAVVASKVGGGTPFVYIVTGIGALSLAWVYGRFARYVPNAGGTYAIVRAGLGRASGFLPVGRYWPWEWYSSLRCWSRAASCCRTSSVWWLLSRGSCPRPGSCGQSSVLSCWSGSPTFGVVLSARVLLTLTPRRQVASERVVARGRLCGASGMSRSRLGPPGQDGGAEAERSSGRWAPGGESSRATRGWCNGVHS